MCSMSTEIFGGSKIACQYFAQHGTLNKDALEQFCLNAGLFIVIPTANFTKRAPTEEELQYFVKFNHNGMVRSGIQSSNTNNTDKKFISYYRWIPFLLFIQVWSI